MIENRFKCQNCNKHLLYRGENNGPAGFVLVGDMRICYNCHAALVVADMSRRGHQVLHLHLDMDFGWVVQSWAGTLRYQTLGHNAESQLTTVTSPDQGKGIIAGKVLPVGSAVVRFCGPDAYEWVGIGYNWPQSDKMQCKRLQVKARANPHPDAKHFGIFNPFTEYCSV